MPKSVRVLIVDDDEQDYQITAGILGDQRRTSFEVDWAPTFDDALEWIGSSEHDVYLIDQRLGEPRSGLDLVRAAFGEATLAPVLLLTGYDDYDVDLEAASLGVTDFLLKARLSPELLERAIRYALSRHRTMSQLRSSRSAFALAKQEAERASRAKDEFLSRVSHELRTPLTAILGYGQLLERDDLDAGQRESVAEILKGGRHLLGLINDLLDLSRLQAGTGVVPVQQVRLGPVVGDALAMIRPLAESNGVRVLADGVSREQLVMADEQRLRQVLINVLSNAVKYNRDGGLVTVADGEPGADCHRIVITDQGPGMSPEQVKGIFTPFDRLGREGSGIEGTGLGMAVSLRLIEAMGGGMDVESELGEGTTVSIELPAGDVATRPADPGLGPEVAGDGLFAER